MKTFTITVEEEAQRTCDLTVEAETLEEAKDIALRRAEQESDTAMEPGWSDWQFGSNEPYTIISSEQEHLSKWSVDIRKSQKQILWGETIVVEAKDSTHALDLARARGEELDSDGSIEWVSENDAGCPPNGHIVVSNPVCHSDDPEVS